MRFRDLKSFLQSGRRLRPGHLTIPHAKAPLPAQYDRIHETEGGFKYRVQELDDGDDAVRLKRFMIEHFYPQAPVPTAINLLQGHPRYPYLDEELDMFLNSGMNISIKDAADELIGGHLNACWERDDDYDAFEVSPVDWLNAGDEIATDASDGDRRLHGIIWRDYWFQLTYHVAQLYMKRREKRWALYNNCNYVLPHLRGHKISAVTFPLFYDRIRRLDGIWTGLVSLMLTN